MLKQVLSKLWLLSLLTLPVAGLAATIDCENGTLEHPCGASHSCVCVNLINTTGEVIKKVESTAEFSGDCYKEAVVPPAKQIMPYGSSYLLSQTGAKCEGHQTGKVSFQRLDGTICALTYDKYWNLDVEAYCNYAKVPGEWNDNKCDLQEMYNNLHACDLQVTFK